MPQTPQALTRLTDFFARAGLHWRLYDCGTAIRALDKAQVPALEDGQLPYPHPWLGCAHLACVLWRDGQARTPSIWFLRFSLDEQGLLALRERDAFLEQLLVSLGQNLQAADQGERLKGVLDNNPYVWEPPEALQAAFHARLTARLKLPPSQHYAEALHYLTQGPWDYWQALGLQGLADLVARLEEPDNAKALNHALPGLPAPVFASLAPLLEHEQLSIDTSRAIIQRLNSTGPDAREITNGLRALAQSRASTLLHNWLGHLLEQQDLDAEALVTLASRHGQALADAGLILAFLEQLARLPQAAFNRVMAELLYQPRLRPHYLAALREPGRSELLSKAIGGLLG